MTAQRAGRATDQPARGSGRRLFVAVPLPDDASAAIGEVVASVRAMPLPTGARDARWVRLDGLHLTLRFLGPTGPELEESTMAAVEGVGDAARGPIAIELAGSGAFPSGRRPRTLWIGLAHGTEALTELAAATEAALAGAGWQPDPRPFRPHLTLARTDASSAGQLMADRLAAAMSGRSIACTIDRVGLFESVTGGGPARYVPLLLRNLGSPPDPSDPVYHLGAPDTS
jgi:2'-5' RNA ligase